MSINRKRGKKHLHDRTKKYYTWLPSWKM